MNYPKKLRIAALIWGSLLHIGGYQVFVYNLLSRLHSRGHHVDLYLQKKEWKKNQLFYKSVNFNVIPVPGIIKLVLKVIPQFAPKVFKFMFGKSDYDLWQVIGAYPAGYIVSEMAEKKPVILRTHGDDIQKNKKLNYGMRLIPEYEKRIKKVLSSVTKVVALTKSVVKDYEELNVPPDKVSIVPNGVDLERFKKEYDNKQTLKKFKIDNRENLILSVGRYHPKKGYELIPPAVAKLKNEGYKFTWIIVGEGLKVLEPVIKEHGVEDRVRLVGSIKPEMPTGNKTFPVFPSPELVCLYKAASVFVMPSWIETFGRVLIEAMAAGTPVVATRVPGCKDVIENNVTGLLVSAGDADALAEGVTKILTDKSLQQKLVNNAFKDVEKYSWENIVNSYEQLYFLISKNKVNI